jgi:Restriction endonuclease
MSITTKQFSEQLVRDLRNNPTSVASVIEKLSQNTDEGRLIDPRHENLCFETWLQVFSFLHNNKFLFQAAEVVMAWYDRLNELQAKHGSKYHKGGVAHNAGVCFFSLGDSTRGVWFYACAYVEDILNNQDRAIPQTLASQHLRVYYNWGQSDFEIIAATARALRAKGGSLWHFPEDTLVELARNQKLKIPLPRGGTDIPVNRPFLNQLIERLPLGNDNQKKESLEFLASYLAITLPGVRINANVKAHAQGATFEHEIDLVVTQYGSTPTYLLDALGRHFLVECKNWDSRVGVRDLNHFVAKMRFHRCKCGVIFSREGLSGDADQATGLRYARVTQLRWYQQDDCVVIVITKQELDELAIVGGVFSELLLRGYESVRFSSN